MFLVLEGVEGSGKSTQAKLLGRWLDDRHIPHTLTREPGGTPAGEAIRGIVLDRVDLGMPPLTELFLILAARAAFLEEVVRPALDRGEVVVSDRFELSTFAYQAYGRGLELDAVRRANAIATDGMRPDLYIYLDVPVAEGLARHRAVGKDEDRIERSGMDFLDRVRSGYEALLAGRPDAEVVDGTGDPTEVHQRIVESIVGRFPKALNDRED